MQTCLRLPSGAAARWIIHLCHGVRSQISPFCQQWPVELMRAEAEAAGKGVTISAWAVASVTSTNRMRGREGERNVMRASLMHYSAVGRLTKKYRNTGQIFDKAGLQSCTPHSQRKCDNSGQEQREKERRKSEGWRSMWMLASTEKSWRLFKWSGIYLSVVQSLAASDSLFTPVNVA